MPSLRFALGAAAVLLACGASPAPTSQPAPASPPAGSPAPAGPSEPAPERPPAPVSTLDPCDEVACVMVNYEDACCDRFKKPGSTGAGPAAGGVPAALTRAMISQAMGSVRDAIVACGDDSSAGQRVKVRVRVHPDGSSEVSIAEAQDARLAECVAAAVRAATYPSTVAGGTFTYPLVF